MSVVIPAYNEEERIAKCLESVSATGFPELEIIVVDDNSKDRTAEVAARYPVHVIRRLSRGGIAAARNDGTKAAFGRIIAFVDADCIVDVNWLDLLTSHFVDDSIGGVGGIISPAQSTLIATYRSFKEREEYSTANGPVEASYLPGGNSSYRAEVLRDVGGFDPAFAQPRGHEAFELGCRIRRKGFRLIGDPRAVVWHSSENSLKAWVRTTFASGYSSLSFMRKISQPEYRVIQVKQTAIVCFLLLAILTLIGVFPVMLFLAITAVLVSYEILGALFNAVRAVAHFRSPSYLVVFPLEIGLRLCLYAGFGASLLAILYRGLMHLHS